MPSESSEFQVSALRIRQDSLEITWRDEHVSRYPGIWLLEACQCTRCGETLTAVRHTRLIDKPLTPCIETAACNDGRLELDWGNGHSSHYPLAWLRAMCLSPQARMRRKFKPSLWGSEMAAALPYMHYHEVRESEDLQLQFLESILHHGFAILQDVPAAREHTEEVTSLVGKLRMTNYGIYELESKPVPEIVGDMAVPLAPHTDEPYRIDPPAITFFHVIAQSDRGGASTLIDSFRLVERLRQLHPQAFDILSRQPAGFHRALSEGRLFAYQHPIIQLDGDGDISSVRLLDRAMAPVDCDFEQVQAFYAALRKLLSLSYRGDGMIEFKLAAPASDISAVAASTSMSFTRGYAFCTLCAMIHASG